MINLFYIKQVCKRIQYITLLSWLLTSCNLFSSPSPQNPPLEDQIVQSLPKSNAKKIIFILNGLWQIEDTYTTNIVDLLQAAFQKRNLPIEVKNLTESDTSKKSIHDQAQDAYEAIKEQLGTAASDYEIILIGHSQGGLRGGHILTLNKQAENPLDIRGLVTLGTPWEGAPIAGITPAKIEHLLNEMPSQFAISTIQMVQPNIKDNLNIIIKELLVNKFPTHEPGVQDMVPQSAFLTTLANSLTSNNTPILSLGGIHTEAKGLIYNTQPIHFIPAPLFNNIYAMMVNQSISGQPHDMVIPISSQLATNITTSNIFKRLTIQGAIHDMLPSMLIPRNRLIYTHPESIGEIVKFTISHCGLGNEDKLPNPVTPPNNKKKK